jgi:hypothetical protein
LKVRILDSLETLLDFHKPDESLEFRFWGGRRVSIEELIDGRVAWKPRGEKTGWR